MDVLFRVRTGTLNKAGKAKIYCRITITGRRKEFTTGISVSPANWSQTKGRVKKDSEGLNAALQAFEVKVNQTYNALANAGETVSPADVVAALHRKATPVPGLKAFALEFYQALAAPGCLPEKSKRSLHNRLLQFLETTGKTDTSLTAVSLRMGQELEKSLLAEGIKQAYTQKVYGYFRQVLKAAVWAGHIAVNPLEGYSPKAGPHKEVIYLTEAELERLYSYNYTSILLRRAVDTWCFMARTSLAYADVRSFNYIKDVQRSQLDGQLWIIKERQKSGGRQRIPLLELPKEILATYNNTLPVYSNQVLNRLIKEAASLAGINKHLTCHVARKTAATYFYNRLTPQSTAAILGHSTTNITEKHYAKLLPETLSADVAVLFNKGAAA